MTTLKDYLGALMAGLNQARAIADYESASLAELYAQSPTMKHFSIPRIRMEEAELTIPVAIDNLDIVKRPYEPVEKQMFSSRTLAELRTIYKVESFKKGLSGRLEQHISKETEVLVKELKKGKTQEEALKQYCSKIAESAIKNIGTTSKTATSKKLKTQPMASELSLNAQKISAALVDKLTPEIKPRDTKGMIENANVVVESDKLREKKPESLLFIKMKISEEGMEWQTMENRDGSTRSKLVQE